MAKFCTRCGRPLQDGEICNCGQAGVPGQTETNVSFGTNENMQMGGNTNPSFGMDMNTQYGTNENMQMGGNTNPTFGAEMNTQYGNNGNMQFGNNPNMQYNHNPNMQYGGQPNMQGGFQQNVNMQSLQNGAEKIKKESMSLIRRILPTFKDPVGQIKDMANQSSGRDALAVMIANIVVIAIISILAAVSIHLNVSDSEFSRYVDIPYAKIVIVITLLSAIYDFGYAGCLYLSSKVFFREDTTFGKMLSVVAGKILLDTIFIVVGCVLILLNTGLGVFVISIGMILTSVVVVMGYDAVSNLPSSKKLYAYFVALIVFTIALSIIYSFIGQSVVNYITQYLMKGVTSSFFKGLY